MTSPSRRVQEVLVREDVNQRVSDEKEVRVEEIVTRVYETPVVEERVSYFQKIVEIERMVPEYQVVEKELEIRATTPRIVEKIVEVPEFVEERVSVPSTKQPKIVEVPEVVEKIIPKMQHRMIERVIEKPKIIEVKKHVVVEQRKRVPGPPTINDTPLVISHTVADPVIKEEGIVEVPVTRILPRVIPVDIVIPNMSISEEELTTLIQSKVRRRLIHQTYREIPDSMKYLQNEHLLPITIHTGEEEVEAEVLCGPVPSGAGVVGSGVAGAGVSDNRHPDYGGAYVNVAQKISSGLFSSAEFNSWLLVLNTHLQDPQSMGFPASQDMCHTLMKGLPFIRNDEGGIPFLEQGTLMNGYTVDPRETQLDRQRSGRSIYGH